MSDEKFKTPEEAAETEMNKKIGKAIAKRMMKIKKLQAEIKKLKSGEMVPDEDDDESSHHNQEVKEVVREIIVEREVPKPLPFEIPYPRPEPRPFPIYPRPKPWLPWLEPTKPYYKRWITCNNLCLCKNL